VAALLAGVLLASVTASPIGATGILPPDNPSANVRPSPNFLSSGVCTRTRTASPCANPCVTQTRAGVSMRLTFPSYADTPACTAYLLRAVNTARSAENLPPMVLPTNWITLTAPEQLFVLADLERTARGLPPFLGLNRALSAAARRAALREVDPNFAPGFAVGKDSSGVRGMGSTLALGYATLEADFSWMYQDGWGGTQMNTPNQACTSTDAPGCWAHRDQLLGSDGNYNPGVGLDCAKCEMGAGFAVVRGSGSFTDLVELPVGSPPPMYFTWVKNVVPFLPQ
jgi:hypothetical protein